MPDEPIEHELLRNAVAAEVTVTNTEVSPTSTGDRYVRIEGRLGDDEESHVEWAALGFIYAIGVLSFAAARPRGVSGMDFEEKDQCAYTGPTQAFGLSLQVRGQPRRVGLFIPLGLAHEERRTVLALGHNVDLERPAVLTAPRTRARFRPRSKDGCKPFEHPEDCQRADGVRWNEVGGLWPGERKPAEPGSDQQGHRNEEKLAQLDADVERA